MSEYICKKCTKFHNRNISVEEFEITNDKERCILHCEKEKWKINSKELNTFWRKINSYILNVNNQYGFSGDIVKKVNDESNRKLIKYEFKDVIFPSSEITSGRLEDMPFFGLKEEIDIVFKNCTFLSDTEFRLIDRANNINFIDCKFYEIVSFERLVFSNLFLFEQCILNKGLEFLNVTFIDSASFIGTKVKNRTYLIHTKFQSLALFGSFKSDDFLLENTYFKDQVGFLQSEVNITHRETARIIKDSFEQQNNIIEANKFYALEMKERDKELKWKTDFFEKLVFKFHGISSNHSQNWLLALFWILVIGMLSSTIDFFYFSNEACIIYDFSISNLSLAYSSIFIFYYLITTYFDGNYFKTTLSLFAIVPVYWYLTRDFLFCNFSKTINPFSIMKSAEDINIIQLFFKIIIAYLIYQLIISIRQNTRRK